MMPVIPGTGLLPLELSSFVGRRAERGNLLRLLETHRLVTIVGPGGVGKSRLAVRVADEVQRRFANGLVFMALAELTESASVAEAMASTLRLPVREGESAADALGRHLERQQILLVLDNCEHLPSSVADLVTTLLAAAPGLTVLATSRSELGIEGEQVAPIGPLGLPADTTSTTDALGFESVRLFLTRAVAASPSTEFTDAELELIVGVCRDLDGLPLAIELAAARVGVVPLARLASALAVAQVEWAEPLSAGERRPDAGRHQNLAATMAWSYALCTPAEQRLWARLSVFTGGWALDAATAIGAGDGDLDPDQMNDALLALERKSIITRDEQYGWTAYRMLETVRQFGQQRLVELGEDERLRTAHAQWYAGLLRASEADWFGPREGYWLNRLRGELPNIRAALTHRLAAPGDATPALELIVPGFAYLWWANSYNNELRDWLDRILPRVAGDSYLHARALVVRGYARTGQEFADYGKADIAEARAMAARLGDREIAAEADILESMADSYAQRYEQASVWLTHAVAALGDEGRLDLRMAALSQLALTTHASGDPRTEQLQREVHALADRYGDRLGPSELHIYLAASYSLRGELGLALDHARRGLEIRIPLAEHVGTAFVIQILAVLAAATGQPERAARLIGAGTATLNAFGRAEPRAFYRDVLAMARQLATAELGEARTGDIIAEGQRLSVGQSIEYALNDELPASSRAQPAPVVLTRREREIADLLAQGLTNRSIADLLVISVRTAEGHVERLRSKLGVSSRTQIVEWVHAHGGPAAAVGD